MIKRGWHQKIASKKVLFLVRRLYIRGITSFMLKRSLSNIILIVAIIIIVVVIIIPAIHEGGNL